MNTQQYVRKSQVVARTFHHDNADQSKADGSHMHSLWL